MSNVATILRNKAAELRTTPESVAVQMLKEAGMSEQDARFEVSQALMEKEALCTLKDKGIDMEEAVRLVKAANINVRELTNINLEPEVDPMAEILEKAAAYIETLEGIGAAIEAKNAELLEDLEKMASEIDAPKAELPVLPESINKLASIGAFTNEDLEQLRGINPGVLEKIASAREEPWGLGAPVGMARPQTDPLLEFMLS